MSYCHIRFLRRSLNDKFAEYSVESFDFHDDHEWHQIGRLSLDREQKQYDFIPAQIWLDVKALHPHLFSIAENERKRIYESELKAKGYGWGAWAMRIHHWANDFLTEDSFPEIFPDVMFSNEELSELKQKHYNPTNQQIE